MWPDVLYYTWVTERYGALHLLNWVSFMMITQSGDRASIHMRTPNHPWRGTNNNKDGKRLHHLILSINDVSKRRPGTTSKNTLGSTGCID
jgi:hypothetical protein